MKRPDCIQGSTEWLRWRSQGIGASAAAAIAGVSPHTSPWGLWMELRYFVTDGAEGLPPEEENFFMRWGKEHEDKVRQCFERKHDDLLLPACGEHEVYPFMRASFDGLTEANEPTELKAPSASTVRDVLLNGTSSTGYLLYWWQVQHQMFVCGSETGYLLFWLAVERLENGTLVAKGLPKDRVLAPSDVIALEINKALAKDISTWTPTFASDNSLASAAHLERTGENLFEFWLEFKVAADHEAQAKLVADCERFWQSVIGGVEPPKDPARDPYAPKLPEERAEWEQIGMVRSILTRQIDNLSEAYNVLAQDRKAVDGELMSMMGPCARGEHAGLKFTRSLVSGSVDFDALMKDRVVTEDDIDAARGKGHIEVRVTDLKRKNNDRMDAEDEQESTAPAIALVDETYVPASEQDRLQWEKLACSRRRLVRQLSLIKEEISNLKSRRKAGDDRLVEMMGDFATACYADLRVSKCWKGGSVSITRLIENLRLDPASLDKYRGPAGVRPTVTDKLNPKKKAAPKAAMAA